MSVRSVSNRTHRSTYILTHQRHRTERREHGEHDREEDVPENVEHIRRIIANAHVHGADQQRNANVYEKAHGRQRTVAPHIEKGAQHKQSQLPAERCGVRVAAATDVDAIAARIDGRPDGRVHCLRLAHARGGGGLILMKVLRMVRYWFAAGRIFNRSCSLAEC